MFFSSSFFLQGKSLPEASNAVRESQNTAVENIDERQRNEHHFEVFSIIIAEYCPPHFDMNRKKKWLSNIQLSLSWPNAW